MNLSNLTEITKYNSFSILLEYFRYRKIAIVIYLLFVFGHFYVHMSFCRTLSIVSFHDIDILRILNETFYIYIGWSFQCYLFQIQIDDS